MAGRNFYLIVLLFLFACNEKDRGNDRNPGNSQNKSVRKNNIPIHSILDTLFKDSSAIEIQLRSLGLVNIHDFDTGIVVDLRYSTTNNFIGIDVYGDFDQCYLQPDVAEKLALAEKFLRKKYPFYTLIIFDAVRPLHIQKKMWDTLVLPPGEKIKYLSNPNNGSLHNYGAAVDLSIIDEKGIPLDMGTDFDYFGEKAHPEKESVLLESGVLTQRQVFNRELLRGVMYGAGFFGIQTEWWHFNSCTREVATRKYEIVE